jgi:hypothetical protein
MREDDDEDEDYEERERPPRKRRRKRPSNSGAKYLIVLGIFGGIAAIVLVGGFGYFIFKNGFGLFAGYGTRLEFKGGELYYTSTVDSKEANRLGNYLIKAEYFDGVPKTVQLNKVDRTYQVRCVVKKGIDTDPKFVEGFRQMGAEISREVFDGARVEVHMCDEYLKTLRVLTPN